MMPFLLSSHSYGQDNKNGVVATLYGGIYLNNDQAWLVEPSVSWHLHKYIGLVWSFRVNITN